SGEGLPRGAASQAGPPGDDERPGRPADDRRPQRRGARAAAQGAGDQARRRDGGGEPEEPGRAVTERPLTTPALLSPRERREKDKTQNLLFPSPSSPSGRGGPGW